MLRETLLYIMENYTEAKNYTFQNNAVADYIRSEAPRNVINATNLSINQYKVSGSPGQGNWATIPWLGIFDKAITTSAMKGYDIVYLFREDMKGVYLSLNQGWTYFQEKYKVKKGKQNIKTVSNAWRLSLSSALGEFKYDIDLGSSNTTLAEGYELGHILGKFYSTDSMPDENALVNDLHNLLAVYRELRGKLVNSSYEITNSSILANDQIGLYIEEPSVNSYDENIVKYESSRLEVTPPPPNHFRYSDSHTYIPKKMNFIKKEEAAAKLGLAGELMVLNLEREQLSQKTGYLYVDKIEHTSQVKGDGAGYDILSFSNDGIKKFIEVKTTTGDINTPFFITEAEASFSRENPSQYWLYRVYDFDKTNNTAKMYVINGSLFDICLLKPQQYIVLGWLGTES